jgi:hypothetical protein
VGYGPINNLFSPPARFFVSILLQKSRLSPTAANFFMLGIENHVTAGGAKMPILKGETDFVKLIQCTGKMVDRR